MRSVISKLQEWARESTLAKAKFDEQMNEIDGIPPEATQASHVAAQELSHLDEMERGFKIRRVVNSAGLIKDNCSYLKISMELQITGGQEIMDFLKSETEKTQDFIELNSLAGKCQKEGKSSIYDCYTRSYGKILTQKDSEKEKSSLTAGCCIIF